jgi:hypothetical protein
MLLAGRPAGRKKILACNTIPVSLLPPRSTLPPACQVQRQQRSGPAKPGYFYTLAV